MTPLLKSIVFPHEGHLILLLSDDERNLCVTDSNEDALATTFSTSLARLFLAVFILVHRFVIQTPEK
jgi:hypothetical protein